MKLFSINKMKNYYNLNRIPIWSIITLFIISIIWLSNSTVNVPIMDYWRYINDLTEKVFRGDFSFYDMWSTMGGHREGIAYLFTAFNIRYLRMNCLLWVYLGTLITLITSFTVYKYYRGMICGLSENEKIKKCLFFLIPLTLFSFNQWEIYTLPFSFSFTLRRLCYLLMFFLVERIIIEYTRIKNYIFEILIYLLIIMLFMSGGYLPALIGSIFFCFIIDTILNFKQNKSIPRQYIGIVIIMFLGLCIYMKGLSGVSEEGQSITNLFTGLLNGSLFKGIFIMLGSSLIDTLFMDKLGSKVIIFIGSLVCLMYILSLIIYFSKKMWKKTYMPLLLILYAGINIIVIYFARCGIFGVEYLASSRYSCETLLGIIGVLHIFIEYILNIDFKKHTIRNNFLHLTCMLSVVVIILLLLASYSAEFMFASNRKTYQNNLINMMLNIDDYSDNELSGFQANKPDMVRKGIYLMKKYKLGIFANFDEEKYKNSIGKNLDQSRKISGIWDDKWLAKESKFKISTGEDGMVYIEGYYPFELINNLTGTIYINNIENKFNIDNQHFTLKIPAAKNQIVDVKINCDFEQKASNDDLRMVTFILDKLEGK